GAVLLCHQPPLQPVGKPADHALKVGQLLVEESAQPIQLFLVAKVFGSNDLVELGRESLVVDLADSLIKRIFRPPRFARSFFVEIRVHHLFRSGAGSFAFAGLIFIAGGLGLFGLRALALRLLLAAFFLAILAFGLILVCLALVALVVVGKFFTELDCA